MISPALQAPSVVTLRGTNWLLATFAIATLSSLALPTCSSAAELRGRILDADTGQPLPARVYLASEDGRWHHVNSDGGTAAPYRVSRSPASTEVHTSLSADPFVADLPPGRYTLTVERGKQYVPRQLRITLPPEGTTVEVKLQRWIDMAAAGWYSGETHVHRSLDELPTAMMADDLNVAFPLNYWVTRAYTPPTQGDKNQPPVEPRVVSIDPTHVYYPLNTEYEIFTVNGRRHTLGAVFGINHKRPLQMGAPPVKPIADEVHAQGGLLELDKHNWPWSMMLIPIMKVDLYELTNNHLWRAPFYFHGFGESPPDYMQIEKHPQGVSERGWIDFTLRNYYALLNCGFRLRPTAGTASGVHPVPLGFGRVFVYLPEPFTYEGWVAGLDAGRSFVTTGPLMSMTLNDQLPGKNFASQSPWSGSLNGWVRSLQPLNSLEVLVNGEVVHQLPLENRPLEQGGFETLVRQPIKLTESGWIVVRCFTSTDDRPQFAHTAPFFVELNGKSWLPRRAERDYLIDRVQWEIRRNTGVLNEASMDEYRQALEIYQKIPVRDDQDD